MTNDKISAVIPLFRQSQKITVFTGAGISTNCGIPDFRGPDGLYRFVQKKYNLPFPEAMFHISYFRQHPEPFFDFSKEFFTQKVRPTLSHQFIAWLEANDKVTLVMTQNIDMLHERAGNTNVIACHGTYAKARCMDCKYEYTFKDIEEELHEGTVPTCTQCNGIIKPDIVFIGERLPYQFYDSYLSPPETDFLLVMGTSLSVQPASGFPLRLAENCLSILVNKQPTSHDSAFTHVIHADLDEFSETVWNAIK